jgi:hypothetical protein
VQFFEGCRLYAEGLEFIVDTAPGGTRIVVRRLVFPPRAQLGWTLYLVFLFEKTICLTPVIRTIELAVFILEAARVLVVQKAAELGIK